MIGQSEKSAIEIESEYQLTGHPVYLCGRPTKIINKAEKIEHIYLMCKPSFGMLLLLPRAFTKLNTDLQKFAANERKIVQ